MSHPGDGPHPSWGCRRSLCPHRPGRERQPGENRIDAAAVQRPGSRATIQPVRPAERRTEATMLPCRRRTEDTQTDSLDKSSKTKRRSSGEVEKNHSLVVSLRRR